MTVFGRPYPAASTSPDPAPAVAISAPVPVEILRPAAQLLPVVLASPHSGRLYPDEFVASSRLDPITLRRSEDAHVDILFGDGPSLGIPLIRATFPRAYLDANREPYELDPAMFDGPLPDYVNSRSPRVAAGLGTIARIVANGSEIYRDKLSVREAEWRITNCYKPYHAALAGLIEETRERFGFCILIDCHSMPSGLIGSQGIPPSPRPGADFVLGDCHGTSCHRQLTAAVFNLLTGMGYHTARNAPYAGGFTTRHYGAPVANVHALQIEISRHLYMNERTYEPTATFDRLREEICDILAVVGSVDLTPTPKRRSTLLAR